MALYSLPGVLSRLARCQAPLHLWQMRRGLGLRDDDAPTTPDIVEGRNMSRAVRALWDIAEACISRGFQAGTPAICKCTVAVGVYTAVAEGGSVTLWTEGAQPRQSLLGCKCFWFGASSASTLQL